jgi:hypothetical protein
VDCLSRGLQYARTARKSRRPWPLVLPSEGPRQREDKQRQEAQPAESHEDEAGCAAMPFTDPLHAHRGRAAIIAFA